MSAFVRRVMHRHPFHRLVPAAPEGVIGIGQTDLPVPLPCGQKREDALADGNFADTSLGLTVPNVQVSLPNLDVLWPQGQVLPDA